MTDKQKELLKLVLNFAYGQVELLERLECDIECGSGYKYLNKEHIYNLANALGIQIKV